MKLTWQCMFSPRLYKIYKDGPRDSLYQPEGIEKWSDKVITMANTILNIGLYTSPFICFYIYKRGFFSLDETRTIIRYVGGLSCLIALSYILRGIGRASNPKYVDFLKALTSPVTDQKRTKLKTADGNEIDTMFVDNRAQSPKGKILVICCEGNSGFYEIGIMTTPLGFEPQQIVMYGWSIGGYVATWAAVNYPEVKALNQMPSSWSLLVKEVVRSHVDLNIKELIAQYGGPVQLVRRTEDEIICLRQGQLASNRGNFLLTRLVEARHPELPASALESLQKHISKYMRDYRSSHCTPLPEDHFDAILTNLTAKY
ncbi:hypothetical protein MSG28_001173 [Choristoneura fumiferana]|uniref:Uncharacterized protein n=2 Tax=Choristoneura fumiferana TaxID=7141 RepID=A0ACC0K3T8_CHOFU|nr:hypothetical protein MSG28_001173 [Choristoneura fumiferana]KAI8431123.1 hypothetical protein MSG28_001173 [Choristoneura fumiferana]